MFNRSMRLYASKLGIQLNDHGAYAKQRNPNDDFWDKPIPVCQSEEDIFSFLGMEYKSPMERDV
jgi:DNA polymerase/3'-5' exonuclease PolX